MKNRELIYGCMGLGKWDRGEVEKESLRLGFKALDEALECGIRTFDLANIYAHGQSEKIFGEYLRANPGLRKEVSINSKAGIVLDASNSGGNIYNSTEEHLRNELKAILQRLKIERLDCFIVHRLDPLTSLENLTESLEKLVNTRLTKTIGLSNMTPSTFRKIEQLSEVPIKTCQIQLSLGHSNLLGSTTFFNQAENSEFSQSLYDYPTKMEFQAWSPLDQGRLMASGPVSAMLKKISKKYAVSTEAVQLAWLKAIPLNIRPIIGTTNPQRIKACTQEVSLERDEWYDLWETALGKQLP